MKLKRGFLNAKRLLCIGLNYNTRELWLLDYVKSIGKGLQDLNSQEVLFEREAAEYVLYNSQKLSLKTFVDDKVDIVDRRSIIQDNKFESYAFYGYEEDGVYYYETDPNPTVFYGYSIEVGDTYEWEIETISPEDENPPIYGYSMAINGDSLLDVLEDPISDVYEELIYTIENAGAESEYNWFREAQKGDRLTILIHNDIFAGLTEYEKDNLKAKLKRYIIGPNDNSFGLEGYN